MIVLQLTGFSDGFIDPSPVFSLIFARKRIAQLGSLDLAWKLIFLGFIDWVTRLKERFLVSLEILRCEPHFIKLRLKIQRFPLQFNFLDSDLNLLFKQFLVQYHVFLEIVPWLLELFCYLNAVLKRRSFKIFKRLPCCVGSDLDWRVLLVDGFLSPVRYPDVGWVTFQKWRNLAWCIWV